MLIILENYQYLNELQITVSLRQNNKLVIPGNCP